MGGAFFSKARSQPKHHFEARFVACQGNNPANAKGEQPPQQTTVILSGDLFPANLTIRAEHASAVCTL